VKLGGNSAGHERSNSVFSHFVCLAVEVGIEVAGCLKLVNAIHMCISFFDLAAEVTSAAWHLALARRRVPSTRMLWWCSRRYRRFFNSLGPIQLVGLFIIGRQPIKFMSGCRSSSAIHWSFTRLLHGDGSSYLMNCPASHRL